MWSRDPSTPAELDGRRAGVAALLRREARLWSMTDEATSVTRPLFDEVFAEDAKLINPCKCRRYQLLQALVVVFYCFQWRFIAHRDGGALPRVAMGGFPGFLRTVHRLRGRSRHCGISSPRSPRNSHELSADCPSRVVSGLMRAGLFRWSTRPSRHFSLWRGHSPAQTARQVGTIERHINRFQRLSFVELVRCVALSCVVALTGGSGVRGVDEDWALGEAVQASDGYHRHADGAAQEMDEHKLPLRLRYCRVYFDVDRSCQEQSKSTGAKFGWDLQSVVNV